MEPNDAGGIPPGSIPSQAKKLGLDNVLLNGDDNLNAESNGLSPEELSGFLTKVVNGYKGEAMTSELEQFLAKAKNDEVIDALKKIGNAEKFYETNATPIKDPSTGKQDPKASELATKLLEKIKPLIEAKRMYNHRIAQTVQKKKKKTRGNPFRVLMGKVGKLLDHGIEKTDIVRYLAKLKYWNGETIERAVDIVRDYNKKKKSKDTNTKSTSKKEVIKDVIEDTKNHKESSYNSNIKVAALDYDKAPDFTKRSTPELIMRVCYLLDVVEDNKSTIQVKDMDKNVDKKSAKSQLKEIRTALEKRGFDKDDLSNLGLGI
jgi:flagellar biosynthesis regulator FlbT